MCRMFYIPTKNILIKIISWSKLHHKSFLLFFADTEKQMQIKTGIFRHNVLSINNTQMFVKLS